MELKLPNLKKTAEINYLRSYNLGRIGEFIVTVADDETNTPIGILVFGEIPGKHWPNLYPPNAAEKIEALSLLEEVDDDLVYLTDVIDETIAKEGIRYFANYGIKCEINRFKLEPIKAEQYSEYAN